MRVDALTPIAGRGAGGAVDVPAADREHRRSPASLRPARGRVRRVVRAPFAADRTTASRRERGGRPRIRHPRRLRRRPPLRRRRGDAEPSGQRAGDRRHHGHRRDDRRRGDGDRALDDPRPPPRSVPPRHRQPRIDAHRAGSRRGRPGPHRPPSPRSGRAPTGRACAHVREGQGPIAPRRRATPAQLHGHRPQPLVAELRPGDVQPATAAAAWVAFAARRAAGRGAVGGRDRSRLPVVDEPPRGRAGRRGARRHRRGRHRRHARRPDDRHRRRRGARHTRCSRRRGGRRSCRRSRTAPGRRVRPSDADRGHRHHQGRRDGRRCRRRRHPDADGPRGPAGRAGGAAQPGGAAADGGQAVAAAVRALPTGRRDRCPPDGVRRVDRQRARRCLAVRRRRHRPALRVELRQGGIRHAVVRGDAASRRVAGGHGGRARARRRSTEWRRHRTGRSARQRRSRAHRRHAHVQHVVGVGPRRRRVVAGRRQHARHLHADGERPRVGHRGAAGHARAGRAARRDHHPHAPRRRLDQWSHLDRRPAARRRHADRLERRRDAHDDEPDRGRPRPVPLPPARLARSLHRHGVARRLRHPDPARDARRQRRRCRLRPRFVDGDDHRPRHEQQRRPVARDQHPSHTRRVVVRHDQRRRTRPRIVHHRRPPAGVLPGRLLPLRSLVAVADRERRRR